MTILSRIRSRVGLLVGIIFLALLAFVLTDLFNSQRGIFGGSGGDNSVGEINGHDISVNEFRNLMDALAGDGKSPTQEEQDRYSDAVWQDLMNKYIYEPQINALGITITDDELAEQMMGDHPSPYMNQFFSNQQTGQPMQEYAGPDGQLSGAKIRAFVAKMDAETETKWAHIETDMRKVFLREKYNVLLRKGFYATNSEVKHEYADEKTQYNYEYIVKKYSDIKDSAIVPTTAELKDYYENNKWRFKQRDAVRNIEYVAFDIMPSANDVATEKATMEKVATQFQAKKADEDSVFVLQNSDAGAFAKTYIHPGQFPAGADSAFLKAKNGDVLGPYINGENLTVYKVYGQKTDVDSMKVRHILVAYKGAAQAPPTITRTEAQAKMRADSILRVIKSGKTKMEDIVEKLTDDPGSKPHPEQGNPGNKGDYGWLKHETPFVQEFKDAGFNNPKGATVVVKTDFGYHVIQVLDQSAPSTKVQVVQIDKKIEPLETTRRDIFSKASEFAGKNNNDELWAAAVKKENLQIYHTDPIELNTKTINGVDNPKDIVRWLYDDKTEVGNVSQPFQNNNRYIIAHVTSILERGYKPFEDPDVQKICSVDVIKNKKAERFIDELNKTKGATLEDWAKKAGNLPVMPGVGASIAAPYIQGASLEPGVVGTLAALAPGAVSAPIKGTLGVYVVKLKSVTKPAAITPADAKAKQTALISGMSSRSDAASSDVLKDAADVVDNRAKHF